MRKGFLVLAVIASFPQLGSAQQRDSDLGITVRVYNIASVPDDVLERAETIATQIFQHAGIELTWTGCPTSVEERHRYPGCRGPFGPRDLIVRILPAANKEFTKQKHVFGVALLRNDGSFGTTTNIYFDRVERITWTKLRSAAQGIFATQVPPKVCNALGLGLVLAHEMGHLLLGSHSHSNNGIMRPKWNRLDLEHA